MSKFCSSCGAPLKDDAKFCASCGNQVSEEKKPSKPQASPSAQPNSRFKDDVTMQDIFLRKSGRLNRLRYFKRSLVIGTAGIIVSLAIAAMFTNPWGNMSATGEVLDVIASIFFLVPSYFLDVRRLQDMDQGPGLAIASVIISFIAISSQDQSIIGVAGLAFMGIYLYLLFREGTHGTNQYGEDPLE